MVTPWGGENFPMPSQKQWMFHDLAHAHQQDGHAMDRSGHYPYIPLPLSRFAAVISPKLKPNMRVLDVGCGAGDKLLAFQIMKPTLRITGIEYDPTMAACARYTCGTFAKIIEGDALTQNYKHYDLIYMYRPMSEPDLQASLQARVMMQMRRGAVLIVVYHECIDPTTGYEFPDELVTGWIKR